MAVVAKRRWSGAMLVVVVIATLVVTAPALGAGENLTVFGATNPGPIDMGTIHAGTESGLPIILGNAGDAAAINVTNVSVTGSAFKVAGNTTQIAAGQESSDIAVTYAPTSPGSHTATLTITHNGVNGPTTQATLVGTAVSSPIRYRVNAGGWLVLDGHAWVADRNDAPSVYSDAVAGSGDVHEATASISKDSTVPTDVPLDVFRTHRFGVPIPEAPDFGWEFPLPNGEYVVGLYFAETFYTSAGSRVFDVAIEGQTVLGGFDVFDLVGPNIGTYRMFPVTVTGGVLNVELTSVVENPMVSAIEVTAGTQRPTPPPPSTTTTIPPGDPVSFDDTGSSIFQSEISWLAGQGITRGCNPPANTRFCPGDFVTRGQMAAFLHRALDDVLIPAGSPSFVDDDGVFQADIQWLAATGVTRGCNPPTNDRFCPTDLVTRGQMAAFLHRALDDILDPAGSPSFVDDGGVFQADIQWLAATGVTRGCNPPTNDRFCPNDRVTREQMAAFLFRALAG